MRESPKWLDAAAKIKDLVNAKVHAAAGRLRKANAKQQGRIGNLERYQEDEDYLAQHEGQQRTQHTGLSLMAKFNRMSEQFSPDDNDLECFSGEVCGFENSCSGP